MLFRTRDLESLLKLFTFSKKRNLERYSRDTVVYGSDFAAIITACDAGRLPFHHLIYRSDIVPPHLVPTEASLGALSRNAMNGVGPLDREGRKAVGEIFALYDQRRCLVGHIFFTPELYEWHFFYFDQRDTAENANHWKGGPHIHLVNWLWRTLDPRSVWRDFVSTNKPPPHAFHLRYDPDDLTDSAPRGRLDTRSAVAVVTLPARTSTSHGKRLPPFGPALPDTTSTRGTSLVAGLRCNDTAIS